jgi:hypothetical protein
MYAGRVGGVRPGYPIAGRPGGIAGRPGRPGYPIAGRPGYGGGYYRGYGAAAAGAAALGAYGYYNNYNNGYNNGCYQDNYGNWTCPQQQYYQQQYSY